MPDPGPSSPKSPNFLPDTIAYTAGSGERGVYKLQTESQPSSSLYADDQGFRSQVSLYSSISSAATMSNLIGPARVLVSGQGSGEEHRPNRLQDWHTSCD
ncbi:hypothetical protein SCHPADRAFT_939470 [Schizopora paradoxa]|uniref:Uncharacterized protein n=1 Tax=Schizopora paradoxa TaxID=27342 RepID=A0A0H2RYJ3_9AGAM|nr:hypothetical protein SCHPADRAFT_939470 [Schizopora paradoxa]